MSTERVEHHVRMKRYIQHRERVLDCKSVIKTQQKKPMPPRSASMPPSRRNSVLKQDEQRKIDKENQRLLNSLIKINRSPSPYTKKVK